MWGVQAEFWLRKEVFATKLELLEPKLLAPLGRPLRSSETGFYFMRGRQLGCQRGQSTSTVPQSRFSSRPMLFMTCQRTAIGSAAVSCSLFVCWPSSLGMMLKLQEPTRSRFS